MKTYDNMGSTSIHRVTAPIDPQQKSPSTHPAVYVSKNRICLMETFKKGMGLSPHGPIGLRAKGYGAMGLWGGGMWRWGKGLGAKDCP